MIKNLTRKAKITISPPDENGDAKIHLHAVDQKEIHLDFACDHASAMRLLYDMLFDSQVGMAAKRLYKH